MSVQRIESSASLAALREEWNALASRFESPLLEHDWFASCAEAFHRDEDLRVLTVREGGELTGAAPFARDAAGGPRLALLGSARLYEPTGWVFASGDAVAELASWAITTGDPLVLSRVPHDSPIRAALEALPATRAITITRASAPSLGVATGGSWEAYQKTLSSRIRRNLVRLRRKAERTYGRVQFEETCPAPADVETCLEMVIRVEGSGWKGRRGSSLAARGELRDFFRRYGARAAASGRLRVATLSFGSDVAAVELSVEAYRRVWQLKIGYAEALAAYSPGLLLTECSIRSAFERGLSWYEFLGSAADWQQRWAPVERQYDVTAVYPMTARSVVALCRDAASFAWRRTATRDRAS